MNKLVEQHESNYTNAPNRVARHMSDFPDTRTSGHCCKLNEEDVENGQTASACCVALLVPVCDGCGTAKIMSGRRSTQSIKDDGFMWMPVKKPGTTHGSIRKVRILNHPW